MALYPLEDYGSLVTLKEDQSEELIVATENYSLASIKVILLIISIFYCFVNFQFFYNYFSGCMRK